MQIRYVVPEHSYQGRKPETYYWFECDRDQALAILARHSVPEEIFRAYLSAIEISFIPPGFLVSEDGQTIDWEFCYKWYESADYGDFYPRVVLKHPLLPEPDLDAIPYRVDLSRLEGIGIEQYGGLIPNTKERGLKASDDALAMAIFVYGDGKQRTDGDFNRQEADPYLAHELGAIFETRAQESWDNRESHYPFTHLFFQASDVPLREIYLRRLRAEKNYALLLASLPAEYGERHKALHQALEEYSDDEACEMFLYGWYVNMDENIKELYWAVDSRIPRPETFYEDEGDYEESNEQSEPPSSVTPHIVANPFLGPQWVPLAKVIKFLIEDAKTRDTSCAMTTYGHAFGLSPDTSPYMQAVWRDGDLHVEISGPRMVQPPLTLRQVTNLEFVGWSINDSDVSNFERVWSDPNLTDVAEFVLTSLVSVYGIEERDFFAFGLNREPDLVDGLGQLDRLKANEGNQWRAIFALKGQHPERS
jgi:hypothetical protein